MQSEKKRKIISDVNISQKGLTLREAKVKGSQRYVMPTVTLSDI